MISTVDLFKEIKIMEEVVKKEKDDWKRCMLKSNILDLKLSHNLRTNTVLIMEKLGVEKVKTEKVNGQPREQKERQQV